MSILERMLGTQRIQKAIAKTSAETNNAPHGNAQEPDETAFADAVFTRDWFPARSAWSQYLANEDIREYLEIGSFEGRSTRFAASLFPNTKLTCIDTFEGGGAKHDHLR